MNTGRLRHRITIQELSNVEDEGGGYEEKWLNVATVWAAIEPLKVDETYESEQTKSTIRYKVTIRYMQGIKPQMRIVYNNRPLKIESIIDVNERHRWLEITCSGVIN